MSATKEERRLFMKRVYSEARTYGMPSRLIDEILAMTNVSFLAVVVRIIREEPSTALCYKVIDQGWSMNYAASILGDWVYDATPRIHTLREALKYYIRYVGELEAKEKNRGGVCINRDAM